MIRAVGLLLVFSACVAAPAWAEEEEAHNPPGRLLVLGPAGRPLPGAFLLEARQQIEGFWVFSPLDPVVGQTDQGGRIDAIPATAGRRGPLLAWAPGLAAAVLPPGPRGATVRLMVAEPTHGLVRLPRGRAAARQQIVALPLGGAGDLGHLTLTDRHGGFEFVGLHTGRWRLFLRQDKNRLRSLGHVAAGSEVGERRIRSRTSITGRLLDGDGTHGKPVAGVVLRFVPLTLEGPATRESPVETKTGPDGTYVADGFDPGIHAVVLQDSRWTFDQRPPVVQAERGRARELAAWFAHRRTDVTGNVLDSEERPVSGVVVQLVPDSVGTPPPAGYEPLPRPTRSDSRGRFRLRRVVPAEGYRLVATAAGYSPWVSRPFRVDRGVDTNLNAFSLRKGWRLEVRVRDGRGAALPGATVRVTAVSRPSALDDPLWRRIVRSGETDADGHVWVADLPADDVLCVVDAPGRMGRRARVAYPRVSDHRRLVLDLEPAIELTGAVVEPAEGDTAGPYIVRAVTRDGRDVREAQTDERGAFLLDGLRETATDLAVYAAGAREAVVLASVENIVPGVERHLEIALPRLHSISGTASGLDLGGSPAFVLATTLRFDQGAERYTWQFVRSTPLEEGFADGRYEVAGLPPGSYTLRLVQGANDGGPVRVLVGAGDVGGIDLTLPSGARIAGAVLDPEGGPQLGVAVRLVRLHGDDPLPLEPHPLLTRYTDSRGEFFFADLAPGLWQVEAGRAGAAPDQTVVRLLDGETRIVRDLVLAVGGAIEGFVESSGGDPLDGVLVAIQGFDEGGGEWFARTGSGGRFRVENLSPGAYAVRLRAHTAASGPFVDAVVDVAAEQTVQVSFSASSDASVEGTLLRGGSPVAGAIVELIYDPAAGAEALRRYRTTTDAGGRFLLEHLRGGDYRIHLRSGAWRTERVLFLEEGDRLSLDLESWEGRLRGTVLTRDGAPVAGAYVSVTPLEGEAEEAGSSAFFGEGYTDPRGAFALRGLPVGVYHLSVFAPGLPPGRLERVEADLPGADFEVEVVLGRGGDLALRVLDEDGRGVTGASLWIESLEGVALHRHPYVTGAAGRIRIEGLPAGTHQLRVHARGLGRPALRRFTIVEGKETALALPLLPAGSLRLVVTGEGADPLARTRVDLVRPSTGEVLARRRPLSPIRLASPWGHVPRTGVVVIPDLEAGIYVARISAGRTYEEARVSVEVVQGTQTSVEVTLAPAAESR